MFSWLKKAALVFKHEPRLEYLTFQDKRSDTKIAKSDSEAFKDKDNVYLRAGKLEDAAIESLLPDIREGISLS